MTHHRIAIVAGALLMMAWAWPANATKSKSVFFAKERVAHARENADAHDWARAMRDRIVRQAEPWMERSDDSLWNEIFGATISRSHMVWSDGVCPACKKPVTMYNWEHDPLTKPWKVWCPHCKETFPKNDFHKFYRSGLDEHGIFDPKRADRSLLFNEEHPDPKDPLRLFGVDDGEGYVDGEKRWRFIGAYLVRAHWTQLIFDGIVNLSAAYAVTGDAAYAHKAGILFDRLADVWPDFDYKKQGYVYERRSSAGRIRYCIDNCEQVRAMAFAYDQVFEALKDDTALVAFLSEKAKRYRLDNPKAGFADIQRNIEERLFRDALEHPENIHCNIPRPDMTRAVITAVLAWPESKAEVEELTDLIVRKTTVVDGVSGEKGLAGYARWAVHGLAKYMAQCAWINPDFLDEAFNRNPQLSKTWRFYIDTWCFQQFYPLIGDTGAFAREVPVYVGVDFGGKHTKPLDPSMYTFLWQLYKRTNDPAYVQVMAHANGGKVDGLPHDLFAADPEALQQEVQEVLVQHGAAVAMPSVNKEGWHLALLRAGQREAGRALWLDYDSWGGHGHNDGMNIGLFAWGMDFMPEFGYPHVEYGGWGSAIARWYRWGGPAHNTVVVDGQLQNRSAGKYISGLPIPPSGKTSLWADGDAVKAVRASGPDIVGKGHQQFERTVAMIGLGDERFYLFDVFRVVGGKDHAKFQHTQDGDVVADGFTPKPAEAYACDLGGNKDTRTVLKDFATDPSPAPGWSVDWRIKPFYEDRPKDVHFRYTDLTPDASASLCKGWVKPYGRENPSILWLPMVMVRRTADAAPLASTFVAVMEPYRGASNIASIQRMAVMDEKGRTLAENNVAVRVSLANGQSDLLLARDMEDPLGRNGDAKRMVVKERAVDFAGDFCVIRFDAQGRATRVATAGCGTLRMGDMAITLKPDAPYTELDLNASRPRLVHGQAEAIAAIQRGGETLPLLQ